MLPPGAICVRGGVLVEPVTFHLTKLYPSRVGLCVIGIGRPSISYVAGLLVGMVTPPPPGI